MVGHQRPRVQAGAGFADQAAQPIEKPAAILVGEEDPPSFDAAHDDVVKRAGEIESRSARHEVSDRMAIASNYQLSHNSANSDLRPRTDVCKALLEELS